MKNLLFIAFGGSLGAILRYIASKNINNSSTTAFPLGTLFVNVTGSFLIGLFYAIFSNINIPGEYKNLVTIGFLGAYTTFATYSLETMNLINNGEIKLGLMNILINNITCITVVFIGFFLSKTVINLLK